MATFSRSHQFAAGVTPAFLPAGGHTVHGRVSVLFWSDNGLTYDLNITRPDGTSLVTPVPASPSHYITFDLHPDETLNVQARAAAGTNINVLVV